MYVSVREYFARFKGVKNVVITDDQVQVSFDSLEDAEAVQEDGPHIIENRNIDCWKYRKSGNTNKL